MLVINASAKLNYEKECNLITGEFETSEIDEFYSDSYMSKTSKNKARINQAFTFKCTDYIKPKSGDLEPVRKETNIENNFYQVCEFPQTVFSI